MPAALSEEQEQMLLMDRVNLHRRVYPDLRLLYAVPNGELRPSKVIVRRDGGLGRVSIVGAKLKRMGVRAGVPDLHLPVARGGYFGLWIELKATTRRREKAGGLSDSQVEWRGWLETQGYRYVVAYGAEEAWSALVEYVRLPLTIGRT